MDRVDADVLSPEVRRAYADAVAKCIEAALALEHGDGLVWWERFRDNPEDPDEVTVMVPLEDVVVALRQVGVED